MVAAALTDIRYHHALIVCCFYETGHACAMPKKAGDPGHPKPPRDEKEKRAPIAVARLVRYPSSYTNYTEYDS